MAAQVGKDGFISFATSSGSSGSTDIAAYIDSWGLNGEQGLAEITGFGDLTKKYAATIKRWTATASGTLDKASTEQQNAVLLSMIESTGVCGTMWLHFHGTTGKWIGKALLTGVSINSQVAAKIGVTYSMQGTSGILYV